MFTCATVTASTYFSCWFINTFLGRPISKHHISTFRSYSSLKHKAPVERKRGGWVGAWVRGGRLWWVRRFSADAQTAEVGLLRKDAAAHWETLPLSPAPLKGVSRVRCTTRVSAVTYKWLFINKIFCAQFLFSVSVNSMWFSWAWLLWSLVVFRWFLRVCMREQVKKLFI